MEKDNYYNVHKPKEDDKVSIAVAFLKDHALQWWTSQNEQELEVALNLTWIDFKKLLVDRFMPEYQVLWKKMNLVQMRHMMFLRPMCTFLMPK